MVDLGTDVIPFRGAMPDAVRRMRTAFPGEAEGRNPRTPLSAAAAPHFRPNHREEEDGGGGGGEEAAERSDPVAVPSVPPLARDGAPSDRLLATEVEACDAARELRKWAARHARSPEVESTLPPPLLLVRPEGRRGIPRRGLPGPGHLPLPHRPVRPAVAVPRDDVIVIVIAAVALAVARPHGG